MPIPLPLNIYVPSLGGELRIFCVMSRVSGCHHLLSAAWKGKDHGWSMLAYFFLNICIILLSSSLIIQRFGFFYLHTYVHTNLSGKTKPSYSLEPKEAVSSHVPSSPHHGSTCRSQRYVEQWHGDRDEREKGLLAAATASLKEFPLTI
jgi:hypothetical protein